MCLSLAKRVPGALWVCGAVQASILGTLNFTRSWCLVWHQLSWSSLVIQTYSCSTCYVLRYLCGPGAVHHKSFVPRSFVTFVSCVSWRQLIFFPRGTRRRVGKRWRGQVSWMSSSGAQVSTDVLSVMLSRCLSLVWCSSVTIFHFFHLAHAASKTIILFLWMPNVETHMSVDSPQYHCRVQFVSELLSSGWTMEYYHHYAWPEQICTSVWHSWGQG